MAFRKVANAMLVHPRVSHREWSSVRRVAHVGSSTQNLTSQAREILGGSLDPDKFLFTHCTIVASVDTEVVPGVKLGKTRLGSQVLNRLYADYHIKPESSQFVNSNGDSWSRQVLMASFPTFIGSHNFEEHVQIEDQSKGRILDAVARDIGPSIYIDILVATSRKHHTLINDIQSGKMSTLSMGCTTDFTICSKCGHVAVDMTDLCDHIKVSKLNTFLDERGQKRVVAELCGHIDYTDNPEAPGGVRFIEASWTKLPAFPGAVMRGMIPVGSESLTKGAASSEIQRILSSPAPDWSASAVLKAASLRHSSEDSPEDSPSSEDSPEDSPSSEDSSSLSLQDVEDEVYEHVKGKIKDRLKKELREDVVEKALNEPSDWQNDTLIKEGSDIRARYDRDIRARYDRDIRARYASTLQTLARTASSDIALVDGVAAVNHSHGIHVPVDVYRSVLTVGPPGKHPTPKAWKQALQRVAGRELTLAELRVVVRVGSLLSRWENNNTTPRSS